MELLEWYLRLKIAGEIFGAALAFAALALVMYVYWRGR